MITKITSQSIDVLLPGNNKRTSAASLLNTQLPTQMLRNTRSFALLPKNNLIGYTGVKFGKTVTTPLPAKIDKFDDYIDLALRYPQIVMRNSAHYLADAMEYFDPDPTTPEIVNIMGHPTRRFKFQDWVWQPQDLKVRQALIGQERAVQKIHTLLKSAEREEMFNKLIIFHGIPGGGKTMLSTTLDAVTALYSRKPDGAKYRLSWVFKLPDGAGGEKEYVIKTQSNPIFVLSQDERQKLLKKLRDNNKGDFAETYGAFVASGASGYEYLDVTSQAIKQELMNYYGNQMKIDPFDPANEERLMEKIKKHIRIERWVMNPSLGEGIVNIRAGQEPMTYTRRLDDGNSGITDPFPKELAGARENIRYLEGLAINAIGGRYHTADMFQPVPGEQETSMARFRHLLNVDDNTLQVITPDGKSLTMKLDALRTGDTNDEQITKRMGSSDWRPFRRRLEFVTVPPMLRYRDELQFLQQSYKAFERPGQHQSPNALEALALFAVTTRLLKPNRSYHRYETEGGLAEAVDKLQIVDKALLLQGSTANGEPENLNLLREPKNHLSEQEINLLRRNVGIIADESMDGIGKSRFYFYDGGFGLATSEAKDELRAFVAADQKQTNGEGYCFTTLDVIQGLRRIAAQGMPYLSELDKQKKELDGLGRAAEYKDAVYGQPNELVGQVERYAKGKVEQDVVRALGISALNESAFQFQQYWVHMKAYQDNSSVDPKYASSEGSKSSTEPSHMVILETENALFPPEFSQRVNGDGPWVIPINDERRIKLRRELRDKFNGKAMDFIHKPEIAKLSEQEKSGRVLDYLLEVMKKEVEQVQNAHTLANLSRLRDFIENTTSKGSNNYLYNPGKFQEDKASTERVVRERAERWEAAMHTLRGQGYCDHCIVEQLNWVFTADYFKSRQPKS